MREINECTAEVFRRSEKRIKERRKKRNRFLALCIPLCLIVVVWSVMILPKMMPSAMDKYNTEMSTASNSSGGAYEMFGDTDSNDTAAEMTGNSAQRPACPYASVEIQDVGTFSEFYAKVTDKVAVTIIFNAIHSLYNVDGADQSNGESFEDNVYDSQTSSTSQLKGYTIIFTTEEGLKTVYNLSENILLNVKTNETVVLSDAQVTELMTVLGISD